MDHALVARPGSHFGRDLVQRNNEATTDMATNPKKMTDPTEAALSAIQDALQVRDPEPPEPQVVPPAPAHRASDETDIDRPWPGLHARDQATAPELYEDEVRMGEDAPTLRRPANDDRESIGQILRTLIARTGAHVLYPG